MTQYTSLGESLDVPDPPGHRSGCALNDERPSTYVCALCHAPIEPDALNCGVCQSAYATDDEFAVTEAMDDACLCDSLRELDYIHPDHYEV